MASHTQKSYRRGNRAHYAKLGRLSVDSRIKRHITVEIIRDDRLSAVPARKRESDAGYDVVTPVGFILHPGKTEEVRTGLRVNCPRGYFFELRGRSSLNAKGIEVMDSVIDATYTGEIVLYLKNRGATSFTFNPGDRIAQLIFLPQIHVKFQEVQSFPKDDEARGTAGFGSSGV